VADKDDSREPEQDHAPALRVVDRRWWAQGQRETTSEEPSLKPTYVEELERRLAEKDAELQATIAKYRGAAAEFDDARARLRKEVAKDVERGRRTLLVELLDVLDNLDRALEAAHETGANEALRRGVELVHQQFLAKLEGFGVVRIAALDQPFDPAHHEAITTVPVDDPARHHTVVGVVRHGYALGDEVLRPALVAVGRHETTTERPRNEHGTNTE
jgi:molecular chaperone GrpE